MIKLIAPDGVTAVAWRGSDLTVAADGTVEVSEAAAETLLTQGFRLAEVPPGPRLVSVGFGYFNVLDADGRKLNAKRLKRAEAEALAADAAAGAGTNTR